MANTWTAYFPGVAFAAGKNMAAIINSHASRVIRIKRVGLINAQTGAVTGVVCAMNLRWYPATATLSAPTTVTPVAHDSTNSALSSVVAGHAGTPGGSSPVTIRNIVWSSDEPKLTTASNNEWEALVPLNIIYDAYGDTDIQPITLRTGQMLCLYNTAGAAGLLDVWIEFTDSAS